MSDVSQCLIPSQLVIALLQLITQICERENSNSDHLAIIERLVSDASAPTGKEVVHAVRMIAEVRPGRTEVDDLASLISGLLTKLPSRSISRLFARLDGAADRAQRDDPRAVAVLLYDNRGTIEIHGED